MCLCFFSGFIDFMWKGKNLLGYNIFLPKQYKKNDKLILK